EDEHAGMPRQHARDLDELTLADAEARHRRCQRNLLHAELIEGAARRLAQMAAAMEQRDLAVAEPDIVLDRERRRERELLRDERDAKRLRLERMADVVPGAVDAHAAGIGAIDAGQKLDERALAGAVLAADRVNLAGAEGERGALQHHIGAEALGDPLDLEDRLARRRRRRDRLRAAVQ